MTKVATTIGTLVMGQVLLASAKNVKGGKIQLEFAEIIDNPNQSSNVLASMNADDERFKNSKRGARRVYLTASPAMALQHFGIDAAKIVGETSLELNILNPSIGGKALRIEVKDSFKGTDFEMANQEKTAKQYTDNEGVKKYFIKDGKLIFSSTKLVDCAPKHSILGSDAQVTWEEYVSSKVNASTSVNEALNAD